MAGKLRGQANLPMPTCHHPTRPPSLEAEASTPPQPMPSAIGIARPVCRRTATVAPTSNGLEGAKPLAPRRAQSPRERSTKVTSRSARDGMGHRLWSNKAKRLVSLPQGWVLPCWTELTACRPGYVAPPPDNQSAAMSRPTRDARINQTRSPESKRHTDTLPIHPSRVLRHDDLRCHPVRRSRERLALGDGVRELHRLSEVRQPASFETAPVSLVPVLCIDTFSEADAGCCAQGETDPIKTLRCQAR